jgi:hypothetical protein
MKVKIFTNRGDVSQLEEEINRWLMDNNVSSSYSEIRQNYIYDTKDNVSSALISIWYEPNFEK